MEIERLSNCELEVMQILWEHQEGLSLVMLKLILETRKNREYGRTTVATWLTRLKKKGYITTYPIDKMTHYKAIVQQKEYEHMEVRLLANRLFNGSFPLAVAAFAETEDMTEEDAKEIQEIIDGWNH